MSTKSQIMNMKKLGNLMSQDLGYIFGERESGPNGAKKQFLSTGRAFLSALGKDLGLTGQKVNTNKAGIAVSGDVTLMGMWSESTGLYVKLEQSVIDETCILYRGIKHLKDHTGRRNNFIDLAQLCRADYDGLLEKLLRLKEDGLYGRQTA